MGRPLQGALIDNTDELLRCMRYIDLNPVRARMSDDPTAFPWSGCAASAACARIPCSPRTPSSRHSGYRALPGEAISDENLAAISLTLEQQRAYSRDNFRSMVEAKTQRFAGVRPAHWPAKTVASRDK